MRTLFLIMAFTLLGCSQRRIPIDADVVKSRLPFLIEKRTTKEEVLARLGGPLNEYENGRIATYILRENVNSRFQVGDTGPSKTLTSEIYNLVLVFGPNGILERYSVIRVR
jgi:hypothetical protein